MFHLFGRRKQNASEAKEGFENAIESLKSVKEKDVGELREKLRLIKIDARKRESELPSIPPSGEVDQDCDTKPVPLTVVRSMPQVQTTRSKEDVGAFGFGEPVAAGHRK